MLLQYLIDYVTSAGQLDSAMAQRNEKPKLQASGPE